MKRDDVKRQALILLLAHREDALVAGRDGNISAPHESRLLSHDEELWCEAFEELERCLGLMRNKGKQLSVAYERRGGPRDGAVRSCSLATARWHLLEWYCPKAYKLEPVRRKARNGKRVTILEARPKRDPEAREDRADAGLAWLVMMYDFRRAYPGLHHLTKPDRSGSQRIPGLRIEGIAA